MKKKHKKKPTKKYRCIYKHNHREPDLEYEFDVRPSLRPIVSNQQRFNTWLHDLAITFLVLLGSLTLMSIIVFFEYLISLP